MSLPSAVRCVGCDTAAFCPLKARRTQRKGAALLWTPEDAERHTRQATTDAIRELWAPVANERLGRTGGEGRAIREANAVIARTAQHPTCPPLRKAR